MIDIDREVVDVLYMAYAYNQEQYGPVFTGVNDYEVPIIDMFLFLYDQYKEGYVTLDSELDDKLNTLYDTLHDAQLQLQGSDYSRFVLNLSLPVEGQETYDALRKSVVLQLSIMAQIMLSLLVILQVTTILSHHLHQIILL